MKILLCERDFDGHREKYFKCLSSITDEEFYGYAPGSAGMDKNHYFHYSIPANIRSLKEYFSWIRQINKIILTEGIDIVHILDGDSIMRFFGIGFSKFRKTKIVITYHHFYKGFFRKISYKSMLSGRNKIGIVHTQRVRDIFYREGIFNIKVCEYPAFDFERMANRDIVNAKKYWDIPLNIPTIGIIGGLNSYKNITQFLNVLKECTESFHLLICGKLIDIPLLELEACISSYSDKVSIKAELLSEDEYELGIAASDIIFCIYGHSFDGASGPLTDGVCAGKIILSCEHGSLGDIVRSNHLGFTAESDNPEDILLKVSKALKITKSDYYDNIAYDYRRRLTPDCFQQRYREIYDEFGALL